jgi:sugar/nucleoside kinase (ribokinase family)
VQPDKKYLLVGNVTRDLLPDNTFITGGTVTYGSVIALNLGWKPTIVTSASSDFSPPSYLAGADWRIFPSPETLTFRNEYDSEGNRLQTIGPVGQSIPAEAIPEDCRQISLVHFCPLAQELAPNITALFAGSMVAATPQGWMRKWDEQGIVSLGDWVTADEILPSLDTAVISLEDVEGDWSIAENWAVKLPLLIVTLGEKGAAILHRGRRHIVPPRPAHSLDPTGAGDVFATAFFIIYYETGDLWYSTRFANVTASMAIERVGPEGAPTRAEIETYLDQNPLDGPV